VPATTATLGLPYPVLSDPPNVPNDIQALAVALDTLVNGVTTVGVPATDISLPNAWTTIATVAVTLPVAQLVEITGWAKVLNSGASNAEVALQITVDGTHVCGTGNTHMSGTANTFNDEVVLVIPRRAISVTSGAHTIALQGSKGANGTCSAIKTETINSQAIATSGIEVTY
jgi:hypothetical protein